jgi:hypothetical protein
MTRFTPEYLEFRETLNNNHLVNLSLTLMEMSAQGLMKEKTLMTVKIGAEIKCVIYLDKHGRTIWLLGGHWERHGEPTPAFLARMDHYASELLQGREPRPAA